MKFAMTRIATNDVNNLSRFYEKVTEIEPWVGAEDNYIEFRTPAGTLAIGSQHSVDMYNAGATTPASNRSAILEFEVEDVDKERARLSNVIAEFVLEPTTQPWGNRSMLFRDPDGNLINFYTRMPK